MIFLLQREELGDQAFFNEVHLVDASLTTGAVRKATEIKAQMQNPDELGNKN